VRPSLPLLLCAAGLAGLAPARAEEPEAFDLSAVEHVLIDDVYPGPGGEAAVDVLFRALTRYRLPVEHLRPVDVTVRQDGTPIDRERVVSLRRVDEAGLGVACVVALDTSRTMMGGPLDRARDQALAFLGKLAPPDRAAVVAFSKVVKVLAGPDDPLEQVRSRLQALEPDREAMSTVMIDGIYKAVELLRGSPALPRRAFVVVFSDGRDSGSSHSIEDVVALAAGKPAEPRLPIFTIGYEGRGSDGLDTLRRLSASTGADGARDVDGGDFYDDVLRQMRGSFVLRFAAALDGAPHRIGVEVEGHSEERSAAYPAIQQSPTPAFQTPWQLPALAAAAVLLLLALWLSRRGGRRPAARLRFVDGPLARQEITLRTGRTRLGALAENDVAIPSPSVSRVHAEIRSEGDHWVIVDLDSTNGTRVNGSPVTSAPLRGGDRIRIGEIEVVFEA
jgi:Mg-chelatase subunit ChlD